MNVESIKVDIRNCRSPLLSNNIWERDTLHHS